MLEGIIKKAGGNLEILAKAAFAAGLSVGYEVGQEDLVDQATSSIT